MSDFDALVRHYAAASDEELREARRLGPEAFRPEAWRVIQAELGRRQLPRQRDPSRERARVGAAGRAASGRRWTTGLLVGIVPAGMAVLVTVRAMAHAQAGGRGTLRMLAVLFFIVWFGVALLVDWRRWWPGRR